MEAIEIQKWKKAGEIAALLMRKALTLSKPETPLLEIAEKIEQEAEKLKVKFAFPINLSIDEIAAHYSPLYDDKTIASGLLKIDMGVSIDGFISDIARTVDLTAEGKYKEMIRVNEQALSGAIKTARYGVEVCEIGKTVQEIITSKGFSPVRNLCGHEMKQYELHAGITIPNYDNNNKAKLQEGIYAIEPFATTGIGIVQDRKPSGVYMLQDEKKQVRDMKAREMLQFISKEYHTLPFSSRWLVKKYGLRALLSLKFLEQQEILHSFFQLVEKSGAPVSQCENTIMIEKNKAVVLTAD